MTDKIGNWDFANFFQRPPEPTEAEKQAYALRRMFYKPEPKQEIKESARKETNPLSEDELNGIIAFEDRRICLTYRTFVPEPPTPAQMFTRHKKFETTKNRLMIVKHRKKLEEALMKTYFAASMGVNSYVPGILVFDNDEIHVPAVGVVDIEITIQQKIQAVLFRPTQSSQNIAYQISDKTIDQLIGAGIIYTTKHDRIEIYEVKKCLAIE